MQALRDAGVAAAQRALFENTLDIVARKVAEDEFSIGVEFPHVTRPDGGWVTLPASLSAGYRGDAWSHGNWNCGFWVGLLLAAHLHTGEARYVDWARERMRLVAQRADDPNTHDIGFIFDSSAIPAFQITGDTWFAELALRAADKLRARVITTASGAYLSAWGPLDDARGRRSSAIDTMANLPLLYWASRVSGDASFRLAAHSHADKTAEAFIRADDSTYHAVEYDEASGRRIRGYTFQGYGDESTWSRGQAWAIYGYAVTARETGERTYLERAERLADYYVRRCQGAAVPPWDFDDPMAPDTQRDSAAAAIVASALLDLGAMNADTANGVVWVRRGVEILETLCRDYVAHDGAHRGVLKHGCYSKPHNEGADSATMFGDFYFIEALCKLVHPGRLRPELTGALI